MLILLLCSGRSAVLNAWAEYSFLNKANLWEEEEGLEIKEGTFFLTQREENSPLFFCVWIVQSISVILWKRCTWGASQCPGVPGVPGEHPGALGVPGVSVTGNPPALKLAQLCLHRQGLGWLQGGNGEMPFALLSSVPLHSFPSMHPQEQCVTSFPRSCREADWKLSWGKTRGHFCPFLGFRKQRKLFLGRPQKILTQRKYFNNFSKKKLNKSLSERYYITDKHTSELADWSQSCLLNAAGT